MKVKYKKDNTIITLNSKEERGAIFNALRFCEIEYDYKKKIKGSIVSRLLNEWMKEAEIMDKTNKKRAQGIIFDGLLYNVENQLDNIREQMDCLKQAVKYVRDEYLRRTNND